MTTEETERSQKEEESNAFTAKVKLDAVFVFTNTETHMEKFRPPWEKIGQSTGTSHPVVSVLVATVERSS